MIGIFYGFKLCGSWILQVPRYPFVVENNKIVEIDYKRFFNHAHWKQNGILLENHYDTIPQNLHQRLYDAINLLGRDSEIVKNFKLALKCSTYHSFQFEFDVPPIINKIDIENKFLLKLLEDK